MGQYTEAKISSVSAFPPRCSLRLGHTHVSHSSKHHVALVLSSSITWSVYTTMCTCIASYIYIAIIFYKDAPVQLSRQIKAICVL